MNSTWGPMSHPATPTIEDGLPPWKDHVYVGFWDPDAEAAGFLHFNSSPNHDTGKAQLSGSFLGETLDIKEPMPAGESRFDSASFAFDLEGTVVVENPKASGRLEMTPRFAPVDFTQNSLLPPLVEGKPLQHFQQGVHLRGPLTVGGVTINLDALGYRTRTWGFRDDSKHFLEYVSLQICFEDRDITAMKFLWPDGSLKTDGFVVTADAQESVVDMHVTRNSAGLTTRFVLDLAGGESLTLERRDVAVALWCPIGLPERTGPTFSAYDEVIEWELGGERAYSLVEQAIVRHVF